MAISNIITPSLDETTDLAVAFYANLLPEDDVSRGADQWKRLRAVTMLQGALYYSVTVAERDALPDRAIKVALDRWGVILKLPRKGATPARGVDVLRVRGTPASAILTTYTLHDKKGLAYQIGEISTVAGAGYTDVDLIAIDTGSQTRLDEGEILTFDDAYPGLQISAELVGAMDQGGDDVEADGPYRKRLLEAIQRPNLGGAESDWKRWAKEVAGVFEAFVYPNRDGLGTVDVAAFHEGSGTVRALSAGERATLLATLAARHPLGAVPRVLETVAQAADVQIVVEPLPDAAWRPDWTDPGSLEVAAWDPVTRILQLSADRPASMDARHRIVVKTGKGQVMTIESLGPSSDELKIATPIPSGWAPVATDPVYPGGPITAPLRDAVIAWIDSLGPVVGEYGTGWKGSLYFGDVFRLAQEADGVLDSEPQKLDGSTFVTVEPTDFLYPDDDKIGYLVVGMVLVRYA